MWARLRRLVRELSELPGWPNVQVDAILLLDDALAAKWQSLDRAADRADDAAFTAGAAAGQTVHAGPAEPSRMSEFYAGTRGGGGAGRAAGPGRRALAPGLDRAATGEPLAGGGHGRQL